jgi:hypothetical protein
LCSTQDQGLGAVDVELDQRRLGKVEVVDEIVEGVHEHRLAVDALVRGVELMQRCARRGVPVREGPKVTYGSDDCRERHDRRSETVQDDVVAECRVVGVARLDRHDACRRTADGRSDERVGADVRADVVDDIAVADVALDPFDRPRLLRDRIEPHLDGTAAARADADGRAVVVESTDPTPHDHLFPELMVGRLQPRDPAGDGPGAGVAADAFQRVPDQLRHRPSLTARANADGER